MLFISPYKNYRQVIHPGVPDLRHPVTMEVLSWKVQPLAAAFGTLGDEQLVFNPLTQTMESVADITTGVYDTEVAQKNEGWTDLEREMVETSLERAAERTPTYLRKLEPVHVAAEAPWQTYDATPPDRVLALANELGLVPEALRYERENGNRKEIVEALAEAMDPADATRADPLTKVDVHVEKPAMRISKAPKTTRSGIVVETDGLTLKDTAEMVDEPVSSGSTIIN